MLPGDRQGGEAGTSVQQVINSFARTCIIGICASEYQADDSPIGHYNECESSAIHSTSMSM